MVKIVTVETIKKSWKSRPRKAVVFWAWIGLALSAAGLVFYLMLKFSDTFLAELAAKEFVMMGATYNWRAFLLENLMPIIILFTCMASWIEAIIVAKWRAFYLLFTIPATIISIATVLLSIFNFLAPAIAAKLLETQQALPAEQQGMASALEGVATKLNDIVKITGPILFYCAAGYASLMTLFSFIAIFYNHTYPLSYARIYRLRKSRIRLSKDGAERSRVRREFYRFYKKKQGKELIGLLVEPYLPRDSELELIPEAIYYMKLNGGDANGEIKGYELDAGLQNSEGEARDIYQQTLEDLESARHGDLSFLKRGSGEPQTRVIVKKIKVRVKPKEPVPPPPDTRPIDDPLWSPDEIQ